MLLLSFFAVVLSLSLFRAYPCHVAAICWLVLCSNGTNAATFPGDVTPTAKEQGASVIAQPMNNKFELAYRVQSHRYFLSRNDMDDFVTNKLVMRLQDTLNRLAVPMEEGTTFESTPGCEWSWWKQHVLRGPCVDVVQRVEFHPTTPLEWETLEGVYDILQTEYQHITEEYQDKYHFVLWRPHPTDDEFSLKCQVQVVWYDNDLQHTLSDAVRYVCSVSIQALQDSVYPFTFGGCGYDPPKDDREAVMVNISGLSNVQDTSQSVHDLLKDAIERLPGEEDWFIARVVEEEKEMSQNTQEGQDETNTQ